MNGTLAAVCSCARVGFAAETLGFGRVAEWFKAAVLKTAPENIAQRLIPAKTQHIRRRRWRVPVPFAKNIPAHRTAQERTMAWRYDEAKLERARIERERLDIEEMDALPESAGVCYFIGCEGIVKIGFTTQLAKRASTLRSNSGPIRLEILATATGGRCREMHYHRRFEQYAIGNEWFTRTPEINAEIARLNASTQRERTA